MKFNKKYKMFLYVIVFFVSLASIHCSHFNANKNTTMKQMPTIYKYQISSSTVVGELNGSKIMLGGFSGLYFNGINSSNGNLNFTTHTDRGPNQEAIVKDGKQLRPFAVPAFQPLVVEFEVTNPNSNSNSKNLIIEIKNTHPLFTSKNKKTSGLPRNPLTDEIPVNPSGQFLKFNKKGLDLESIAILPDKTIWMGDEYGPSLVHFDNHFVEIERLNPDVKTTNSKLQSIPSYYSDRKMNRGFEGLTLCDNKIYAFLQSPLPKEAKIGVMRILEYNLLSKTFTGEYLYALENPSVDKLGDAACIRSGEFLIIEQDSKTGVGSTHKLFKININQATNLLTSNFRSNLDAHSILQSPHFKLAAHEQWLDLVKIGIDDIEKIEGLSIIDKDTVALIEDNDFGLTSVPQKNTSQFIIIKNNGHSL